jgi:hypothetical protein
MAADMADDVAIDDMAAKCRMTWHHMSDDVAAMWQMMW